MHEGGERPKNSNYRLQFKGFGTALLTPARGNQWIAIRYDSRRFQGQGDAELYSSTWVHWQEGIGGMVKMGQDLSTLVGAALRKHQHHDFAGVETMGVEAIYNQVLAQDPKYAGALHLYGFLCDDLVRADEAVAMISRAIKCNPVAYPWYHILANIRSKQGRYGEAILQYRTAIKLKPDYAIAHNNISLELSMQGDHVEAKTCFQDTFRSCADCADPHYNLRIEYRNEGALSKAITSYRHAVRINHRHADAVVEYAQGPSISPDSAVVQTNGRAQLFKPGRVHEASADPLKLERSLRVGYVSSEFRHHVAALWMEPLLAGHQHQRFSIFRDSNFKIPDAATDHFTRRPTQVQVSWFGLPVSTGLQAMDYRLSDQDTDPQEACNHYGWAF